MPYISRKRSVGAPDGNENRRFQLCQSDTIDNNETTAEIVARETGVSPRTIKRDAAYAEAGKRKMAVIGGAKNQNAKVAI